MIRDTGQTKVPYDIRELDRMIVDTLSADALYRPGKYWRTYVATVRSAIEQDGLDEFRSNVKFDGFCDVQIYADYLKSYRVCKGAFQFARKALKGFPRIAGQLALFDHVEERIRHLYVNQVALAYRYVMAMPEGPQTLSIVEDSGLGAPLAYRAPDGRRYTVDCLNKVLKYLLLERLIGFRDIGAVIELGGGFGMQAEVMLKAQPHLIYIIVDIAPQLFVSQSYLTGVFGDRVLSYSESRSWPSITRETLSAAGKQVVMLAPHDLSKLEVRCDLFFSDYAMMEIDFAALQNYAKLLRPLVRSHVFIADRVEMPAGSRDRDFTLQDVAALFSGFSEVHRSPYEHVRLMANSSNQIVNLLLAHTGV